MPENVEQISGVEAVRLASEGAWFLDVREQWEWDDGHIASAHLIPMSVIEERSAELPTDERIVVICHSGARSGQVAAALLRAGYDAVNVAGGMIGWQSAGGVVTVDGSASPLN